MDKSPDKNRILDYVRPVTREIAYWRWTWILRIGVWIGLTFVFSVVAWVAIFFPIPEYFADNFVVHDLLFTVLLPLYLIPYIPGIKGADYNPLIWCCWVGVFWGAILTALIEWRSRRKHPPIAMAPEKSDKTGPQGFEP